MLGGITLTNNGISYIQAVPCVLNLLVGWHGGRGIVLR